MRRTGLPLSRGRRRDPRVLIIVQNLAVPADRRVWQECCALRRAGYGVSVICPRAEGTSRHRVLEGVHIHGFRTMPATGSPASYLLEFLNGLVRTALLSGWILLREGFDIVQTCNPPDTMFLLGRLYRSFGKPFVYDQHDLCPEVLLSRFPQQGRKRDALMSILTLLERETYNAADHVIVPNDSYRALALERGKLALDKVTTVMSTPDHLRLRRGDEHPELRAGRRYLACYLGIMGPQDGVDLLLAAIHHYVHVLGRNDCQFALLGFGDCFDELQREARDLCLTRHVRFTGYADATMISAYLSTADVGLAPDPLSPFNDISTMNKTLEYMAFELPVLAFDLRETKRSAADAAVYVQPNDVREYARALADLLDDPARRQTMGLVGRARIERNLSWQHQADAYVRVFDCLVGRPQAPGTCVPVPELTAVPVPHHQRRPVEPVDGRREPDRVRA